MQVFGKIEFQERNIQSMKKRLGVADNESSLSSNNSEILRNIDKGEGLYAQKSHKSSENESSYDELNLKKFNSLHEIKKIDQ